MKKTDEMAFCNLMIDLGCGFSNVQLSNFEKLDVEQNCMVLLTFTQMEMLLA